VAEERFHVLERGPWPAERVRVVAAPPFVVAPEHEPIVERAWRAALEDAERTGRRLFPGALRGLSSFALAGDALELALHATDYRAFVGTNLSAEYRATSARCADALGISVVLEIPGEVVLLHRRGAQSFEWPLAIDTPGGHVEPGATPFDAALEELESELGVRAADVASLELLGLVKIAETRKPQAVLRARARCSLDEIASSLEQARERFETSELLPVPRAALAALAASSERVTPAGRAALSIAAGAG